MKKRAENGAALILTLLIIVIIFVLASVSISILLNTTKQNQLSKKNIQATNLAEMAVLYFEQYVNAKIDEAENLTNNYFQTNPKTSSEQLTDFFCQQISIQPIPDIRITNNPSFKARIKNVSINRNDCNNLSVQFVGEGQYEDYKREINGNFFIINKSTLSNINNGNLTFPIIPSNYTFCSNIYTCQNKSNLYLNGTVTLSNKSSLTINDLYINGALNMSSNHNKLIINSGDFYVNGLTTISNQSVIRVLSGNAYFKDISGANNGEIHINGDAYIFGDITKFRTSKGNQLFINVDGTIYVSTNSDLPTNYSEYCNAGKNRGICANAYAYMDNSIISGDDTNEFKIDWEFDQSTISIEYR